MIASAATVEGDLGDTCGLRALGNGLAYPLGGFDISTVGQVAANIRPWC